MSTRGAGRADVGGNFVEGALGAGDNFVSAEAFEDFGELVQIAADDDGSFLVAVARAFGDDGAPPPSVPERPTIKLNRWQEDWSVLADPRLRTEPLDNLKYIPLNPNDPQSYMSLGVTLRERVDPFLDEVPGAGDADVHIRVLGAP